MEVKTMSKLYRNYFVHNMFAHPAMEILSRLGFARLSEFIHDVTLPKDEKWDGV